MTQNKISLARKQVQVCKKYITPTTTYFIDDYDEMGFFAANTKNEDEVTYFQYIEVTVNDRFE